MQIKFIKSAKEMKVIVLGAGSIGTLFGTTLIKGGHEVIFLDAWQPLIYAIHKEPYAVIKHEDNNERIPIKLYPSHEPPASFEPDLVIVSVKSVATKLAIKTIKNLIKENTVVLTCQGGFENADIIAEEIPNKNLLIHGCTRSHCKSVGPMTIEKYYIGDTIVWPYEIQPNQQPSENIINIIELCNKAGLKIQLSETAIAEKWKILLGYPTIYALAAVCGLTIGNIWNTNRGEAILTNLVKEVVSVAQKEGIREDLFNFDIAMNYIQNLAENEPDLPGTILLDVVSHRVTEVDATSGALLRKGEKYGLSLPTINAVYCILRIREENYGYEYESR